MGTIELLTHNKLSPGVAKARLTVSIMTTKKQEAGVLRNKSTSGSPSEDVTHNLPPGSVKREFAGNNSPNQKKEKKKKKETLKCETEKQICSTTTVDLRLMAWITSHPHSIRTEDKSESKMIEETLLPADRIEKKIKNQCGKVR